MARAAFVLVHPAWHGAWCWKKVAPRLRSAGHDVIVPTLTGLGDRLHLAAATIDLKTHVTDVVNAIEFEDLHDVVLVGHSSSGAVVTGVADRVPERIANVTYIDAFVPQHGECVFTFERMVETEGDGWLVPRFAPPPWETILREMWGVQGDDDVRWMRRFLRPTPVGHFREAVVRTNAAAEALPRTFVRCTRFSNPRFDRHAEMARTAERWRYLALEAPHLPAVTAPDEVAQLLLSIAK